MINYWKRFKQATDAARCINTNQSPEDGTPLTLTNLSSAFIILPLGWFLSLVVFFIEKLYSKVKILDKMKLSQKDVVSSLSK